MKAVFVDTSAWWAYFDRSDQWHPWAAGTMARLLEAGIPLVTTRDVFDEVVTGLLTHASHAAAVQAGNAILASPTALLIPIDEERFQAAWRIFRRHDRMGWSLTDCTSMAVMKAQGLKTAFTFDSDFERMGFEAIPDTDEAPTSID